MNKSIPTKIKFQPLAGRVLVEILDIKPKNVSGIELPETVDMKTLPFDEHPYQAVVKAVGEQWKDEPMEVKVGDKVYLERHPDPNREGVLINKKVYACIRQSLIVGIIR